MFLDQIQCWRFAIQPGLWADKGIATSLEKLVFFSLILKALIASMLMV